MSKESQGLYLPQMEHDSCGIGFVVNLQNKPSHDIITKSLYILESMEHRGGCGCDANSGDGAGILIKKPHHFLSVKAKECGIVLGDEHSYGVAQIFFPRDLKKREACKRIIEATIKKIGCGLLGYRAVEVDNSSLGEIPLSTEPHIEQLFISRPEGCDVEAFERKLFIFRKYASHQIYDNIPDSNDDFYVVSSSYKTMIYKGQLNTAQVRSYFVDLSDDRMATPFALIHSRFSTNTFPKWKLAQPFRYLAHNGEINTIRGNVNWIHARQVAFKSSIFTQEELDMLFPICKDSSSDSANLDMIVEMLTLSGRSLPEVFMMLIPEAWQEYPEMEEYKRDFYRFHAHFMEPWDGPASICFTDGKMVGATLDRNGLRPSRYCLLDDGLLIMASEAGALPVDPAKVIKRGRLQPGKIFIADLEQGRIVDDKELKEKICSQKPYKEWLALGEKKLADFKVTTPKEPALLHDVLTYQQAFGYTSEEVNDIIAEFAKTGKEPLGSMGLDTALPILSEHPQHISNYFKQLFAQVTNPPIDPIREKIVMSLNMYLGTSHNILEPTSVHAKKIILDSPVLTEHEMAVIRNLKEADYKVAQLEMIMPNSAQLGVLENAIDSIAQKSIALVKEGVNILILSDKNISEKNAPIPALLALGAVQHALIREKIRSQVSIVLETADARETHHFATLFGFGAHAVYPYLAYNSIATLKEQRLIKTDLPYEALVKNYIKGICYELRKIISKMGISTLQSYHGSQIFEILGLGKSVVDKCFSGSISRIGGLSFDDLAKEILAKHQVAFFDKSTLTQQLEVGGVFQWKRRGEYHLFNPTSVHYLQQATQRNDYAIYKKYAATINDQSEKAATLRGLFEFTGKQPIPIEQVEPAEAILKRFATGAMSFGSISHEAHSTLAIAMNRIGAKSNSGEGGEDYIRFEKKPNGDSECSAIKQVASARFGVTSYYLSSAKELQIKMAQGAKPGEGGQLPGHKVDEWIARVRHSTPGVGLISPPPHHDIYSIEDLAQLIFDLKNANRDARISVKLVSEAGVGTVASGVAKAYADVILIAGHDGGTGASPLSSIRHAGLPWELGLAESHQVLVRNQLRSRVVLQADGQMKTGRDLAVATLLGAEEWGVATAALVVEGCILMRKCHLNTCPVGVATQDKTLRKRFTGKPEHVVNFFHFLVQELREIMAELGFRTIQEMVGRVDKLKVRDHIQHWKYKHLDFKTILHYEKSVNETQTLYQSESQPHAIAQQIDHELIRLAQPALDHAKQVKGTFQMKSNDRATGTMLSHEISKKYKQFGLAEDTIHFKFRGSAGQSFGAFGAAGLTMELEGEANDYFGKGLSGGKLILYPFAETTYKPSENIIVGNVCFYGATSGEAYIRGVAGERFCVRNSGATVVVEGVGDHGCEYMTGGRVLILGEVGRNFAAGMSGGIAYVFDQNAKLAGKCNKEMVELESLQEEDQTYIQSMLQRHMAYTNSDVAEQILKDIKQNLRHFVKVIPTEYKHALAQQQQKNEQIIA